MESYSIDRKLKFLYLGTSYAGIILLLIFCYLFISSKDHSLFFTRPEEVMLIIALILCSIAQLIENYMLKQKLSLSGCSAD